MSAWGAEKADPTLLTTLNHLFLTCQSSSHLSPPFLPRNSHHPTLSHTCWAGRMLKGHDWICQCRQRKGRRERSRLNPQVHLCQAQGLEFGYSDGVLCEKSCATPLGRRCRARQLPTALCHLWWPQECAQAVPGLRAQTRWCNSSGFISLAINEENTTDGRLLLPIAPDLFRILPSRVWLLSWVFLGIIQGGSKAQTKSNFMLHISKKD